MSSAYIKKQLLITSTIIFAVIAADQLTKLIAKLYLRPVHSIPVFGDFLKLTYVENQGMAFGIQIANKPVFNILSVLAIIVIIVYLFKLRDHSLLKFSFTLILGGAFGNLIDRILNGRVVDFIDVEFFDINFSGAKFLFFNIPPYYMHRWPVFNIADMAVSIGMILIILTAIFERKPDSAVNETARQDI
ncbi:MAG: signal peptidase II [Calditrichia bacterium]